MVTATLTGFQAPQVKLFARYKSTSKWEEAPMLPRASGSAYEFLFAGLPEPVEYYVEAAGVRSKTYKLDVVDLPGIKKVKVTYHYPSWLELAGCGRRSGRRSARRGGNRRGADRRNRSSAEERDHRNGRRLAHSRSNPRNRTAR